MFTGLVEAIGILRLRGGARGGRAVIETSLGQREPLVLGESVAVNGACLTVTSILERGFEADVSAETLARTSLGSLDQGAKVHLERATPLGGRMGGHTVLGHVDGLAELLEVSSVGEARSLRLGVGRELAPFLATKGSVALDGVSLTLNEVLDGADAVQLRVMVVPHTLSATLLGEKRPGARLNVEVDVLARYVARGLEVAGVSAPSIPSSKSGHSSTSADLRMLEKLRAGGWT